MKRRAFIAALGAVTMPFVARAQAKMRRIGVMIGGTDVQSSEGRARLQAFQNAMQQIGWIEGRNISFEVRWGGGDLASIQKHASELVALAPDVILAAGTVTIAPLLQATRSIPIVFVNVADPVGAGFVDSLARPGGNITGFVQFEYSLSAKWLELLKETAPSVTQVGVLRDPALSGGVGQFAVIQSVAPSARIEVIPVNVRDLAEMERRAGALARAANSGLIVTASALAAVHVDEIVKLAERHKLPAVYFQRNFVVHGGLMSYGSDIVDQHRRAASYVDRVLKGEKPADLPVQAPTKYELIVNLKTAKTIGLAVPSTILARADEVIE